MRFLPGDGEVSNQSCILWQPAASCPGTPCESPVPHHRRFRQPKRKELPFISFRHHPHATLPNFSPPNTIFDFHMITSKSQFTFAYCLLSKGSFHKGLFHYYPFRKANAICPSFPRCRNTTISGAWENCSVTCITPPQRFWHSQPLNGVCLRVPSATLAPSRSVPPPVLRLHRLEA